MAWGWCGSFARLGCRVWVAGGTVGAHPRTAPEPSEHRLAAGLDGSSSQVIGGFATRQADLEVGAPGQCAGLLNSGVTLGGFHGKFTHKL
jgi:hypothetical protein